MKILQRSADFAMNPQEKASESLTKIIAFKDLEICFCMPKIKNFSGRANSLMEQGPYS